MGLSYGHTVTLESQRTREAPELQAVVRSDLPPSATCLLEVDLEAFAHNYRVTRSVLKPNCHIAGVLKSEGYGLGMAPLARILWREGCCHFFTAFLEEALQLRQILPKAHIYVLSGVLPHTEDIFEGAQVTPVLVDRGQIERWSGYARKRGRSLDAILHVDTGMTRSGLSFRDVLFLSQYPEHFKGLSLVYVMSHLASSDEPENPQNHQQKELFQRVRSLLPKTKASLSNSSGIALGEDYHFDLVRPGIGLLGYASFFPKKEEIRPTVKASARVVQLHDFVSEGQLVGYNGTYRCTRPSRLATLGIGYRDGLYRCLSNVGQVWFGSYEAPIVGRISMDFMVVDVTHIPESLVETETWATLFETPEQVHKLAQQAGSIHYELFTSLGSRYYRCYSKKDDTGVHEDQKFYNDKNVKIYTKQRAIS